jgi:uncharacterized protein YutE (UPF0331/DUF86 family)
MSQDRVEHHLEELAAPVLLESLQPRLRALFMTMPDVRLAYVQPAPADTQLCLSGPDRTRVVICFARSVSGEHISKRLAKIRRHFKPLVGGDVEFCDIENLDYREACEVAFNAPAAYGSLEAIERDRLYRYNVFLEWNASKRVHGNKQDAPPVLTPPLDMPPAMLPVERFITPLYRQIKLLDNHLDELRRFAEMEPSAFVEDAALKSRAESLLLKSIQSAILVTMSVIHRTMRLAARDYRDLFLLLPLYGMMPRERASRLAKCTEMRDRLMFKYEEVTAVEVFQHLSETVDTLREYKTYMVEWLFDRYYGPTGELIQADA